ncbi:unnamed protein product, partial [Adineta steineri]
VIGIMGIEMAGGVYCPLSPRDPQHRLHVLTQQTQSRFVLVHDLTKTRLDDGIILLDIASILTNIEMDSITHVDRLSNVAVVPDSMGYIIFTSGSTGTPKPAQLRHRNFTRSVQSLVHVDIFNKNDTIIQMARCERCSVKLVKLLESIINNECSIWNLCGPAETTLQSLFHQVNSQVDTETIPLGRPLPNYSCTVEDNFGLPVFIGQEGEILVRGVGIFPGYLGRDDLTAKALVEIDGQLFYRTGDLVTMDKNGLLHYQGRKDHQIKLHGQRIELGEIERCLLNITAISACVVMKWNDDYLVAYVQSSHINEEELREHCQSHLPPHMIPSIFVILEKLPLNQNGKVDRKLLPSPEFSVSTLLSSDKSDTPLNQFEERIQTIWCQVLHSNENNISRTISFFSVGGHSLLFIELYHHYQSVFNFDAHTLSIASFLQQPTIFQHSQLLQTVIINNIKATQWHTLHINKGNASFAQERIFLDEQVRFSSDIAIYNELSTLQVVEGSLSLDRLSQALRYVLNKHRILRTSLVFNNDNDILNQHITDIHKTFTIIMNQTFENENELRDIIYQTTSNPNLFDLSTGHVFHAEILRHQISSNENENNSNESVINSDVLLIAFHHA